MDGCDERVERPTRLSCARNHHSIRLCLLLVLPLLLLSSCTSGIFFLLFGVLRGMADPLPPLEQPRLPLSVSPPQHSIPPAVEGHDEGFSPSLPAPPPPPQRCVVQWFPAYTIPATPEFPVEIRFRTPQPEDLPAVQHLHEVLFPVKYTPAFYRTLLSGRFPTIVGVARRADVLSLIPGAEEAMGPLQVGDPGQVLLCVAAGRFLRVQRMCERGPPEFVGYLGTFGVAPFFRRRGLGSYLLQVACRELVQQTPLRGSCSSIDLHVLASNQAAINLYTGHGFQIQERLRDYYAFGGSRHDALKLRLSLVKEKRENRGLLGLLFRDDPNQMALDEVNQIPIFRPGSRRTHSDLDLEMAQDSGTAEGGREGVAEDGDRIPSVPAGKSCVIL